MIAALLTVQLGSWKETRQRRSRRRNSPPGASNGSLAREVPAISNTATDTDFPPMPSLRVQKSLLKIPEYDGRGPAWDRENPSAPPPNRRTDGLSHD